MTTGSLYIISAPSGCGKTTLVQSVVASIPQLTISISYTTRARRPSEIPGLHYHFVSIDKFQAMTRAGSFLEHAKIFSHYYGTVRKEIDAKLQKGMDIIIEANWQGMRQIKVSYPTATSIFIVPPSLQSLGERLANRGEDSRSTIETRLQQAHIEISYYQEYDYLVLNKEFQQAEIDLRTIIQSQRLRTVYQHPMASALLESAFL
jgi:guanylate kinase